MASGPSLTINTLRQIFPFSLLDESALNLVLPRVNLLEAKQGNLLYTTGDIPDFMYFIISGEINLITHDEETDYLESALAHGDHFGAEALSGNDYRLNEAVCATNARLVRIDKESLEEISQNLPHIKKAFRLIQRTEKLWSRLVLPWLGDEEKVLLISRRHPFFLLLRLLLAGGVGLVGGGILLTLAITPTGVSTGLLIFALFILLLGAFVSIWAGLEWTNDYFFITAERVLVQKKMVGFFDSRQESPYNAILSTGLESSFWGRLIGFGSIHLKSYTGDITFKRLPFPETIYALLEHQRHRSVRDNQQQDHEEIRETLQNRLEGKTVRNVRKENIQPPGLTTTYTSGTLLDALSRFYGLRFARSDTVTYRTHWWILLKKTILPTIVLIAAIVLVVIKWAGMANSLSETQAYGTAIIITLVGWLWWLYQYFDWHNDIYIITSDQLVDVNRKPLGKEERRSAPIKNIQTVQFKRKGIIGLVLNYGTVRIQIGNEELTFDNVYDPASIQAEIFANFKKFNQRAQKMEQEQMAEWIKTYDEIRNSRENSSGTRSKKG